MPELIGDDGVEVAYDRWGRRDGPAVLLIQGLGMDSRGWALQRMALGRRYRCFAPDNRGVGQTGAVPGPYSLDRMARDAVAVLDAEGVSRAHIIGASMGGVIAQIIGVLHPERTRSLVLACTSCRHHQWRRELLQEWADAVLERGSTAALGDDGLRWLVGPRLRKRFGMWLNILARILLHADPKGFARQVQAILDAPDALRFELRHVRVPALVITGSQDALTPIGDAEELAEMIPFAQLVELRGAAHGLMVEAPNAFNDAVLDFLDRVSGLGEEVVDAAASA
ncbi:MAG TPA: alpha/beta hydrolase [Acidimicrobiia bacterium]|jgi:pimeloyl-ACP methyl ester carboxylesterase|nr:alpha/beta hydrolase [Acidimicrobiia bacterium]